MISVAVRLVGAMAMTVALAACDRQSDERAQAAGEILEGTASDAMLATDQVRSEAPLAPRTAAGPTRGERKGREGGQADPAAPRETPEPGDAPASAEPSPPSPPATAAE